jgi:hypothetical protein
MSRACLDLWQALSEITEDGELKAGVLVTCGTVGFLG